MSDLNKVMLMGHLTRDPELKFTPKGTAVGDLGMAINMTSKGQDGQTKEEVCYVDVVAWGRQAETCKEYLSKGSAIFVEGRLQLDQWETKEGEKKSKMRVRAERIQFLGGKPSGGKKPRREEDDEKPAAAKSAEVGGSDPGDGLPF